jgi:hypothetical protein
LAVKLVLVLLLALSALLLAACVPQTATETEAPPPSIAAVLTGLDAESCETKIDPEDPNQTTFRLCPGPAGYSLIVRRVASGRHSVEIVDPSGKASPLDYQEVVTRAMSNVTGKAEWRVLRQNGTQTPVALIVRLQARADLDEPEIVTTTLVVIARITAAATCVTDVFAEGAKPQAEWQALADTAAERPCVPALPPRPGASNAGH